MEKSTCACSCFDHGSCDGRHLFRRHAFTTVTPGVEPGTDWDFTWVRFFWDVNNENVMIAGITSAILRRCSMVLRSPIPWL